MKVAVLMTITLLAGACGKGQLGDVCSGYEAEFAAKYSAPTTQTVQDHLHFSWSYANIAGFELHYVMTEQTDRVGDSCDYRIIITDARLFAAHCLKQDCVAGALDTTGITDSGISKN